MDGHSPAGARTGAFGPAERIFDCTDTWQKFEINGVRSFMQGEKSTKVSPQLEMAGKGTAWFDVLQVYPDMELNESRGGAENLRIIELKCVHPDGKIFYTTDGSEPTMESLPYLIPVEIDEAVLLKAATFKDGMQVGYIERK